MAVIELGDPLNQYYMQWDLSITVTLGTGLSGYYKEVTLLLCSLRLNLPGSIRSSSTS